LKIAALVKIEDERGNPISLFQLKYGRFRDAEEECPAVIEARSVPPT
jgi:hypothetical protein